MDDDQPDLTAKVDSRTPEAVNVDATYLLSQSSVSAGPTVDNLRNINPTNYNGPGCTIMLRSGGYEIPLKTCNNIVMRSCCSCCSRNVTLSSGTKTGPGSFQTNNGKLRKTKKRNLKYLSWCKHTLLETNTSHLWTRKIIFPAFPAAFNGDINMLVPWRVTFVYLPLNFFPNLAQLQHQVVGIIFTTRTVPGASFSTCWMKSVWIQGMPGNKWWSHQQK